VKSFELIISLIIALSKLAWPALLIIVIFVFKEDIRALLKRLRKGKLLGQELELDPEIQEFQRTTELAEKEVAPPITPAISESVHVEGQASVKIQVPTDTDEVLSLAASSPEVAIIRLSALLERELRLLLGDMGILPGNDRFHPIMATGLLINKGYLPKNTITSLQKFWELRNKLVHGQFPAEKREILAVIDIGLSLLRTLRSIPHEINRVHNPGVAVFEDHLCQRQLTGVVGLVLETQSPGGMEMKKRIFPTTRIGYYQIGRRVAWEWNFNNKWGETWYRDLDTGEPRTAWSSSAEFVGRHIDEL
jgi:hypothetical protein